MAAMDFSRQLRLASTNNTEAAEMFSATLVLSDCESPNSISVQTKQRLPLSKSENLRHRLDDEQEIGDEEEGDDGDEADDNDDDDADDDRVEAYDNDHQNDILAQFNDDDPTTNMNDSTNLQDCIDALDSVIEQVPSYNIYNSFGEIIHNTPSNNTNNHHNTYHQSPIDQQQHNINLRSDLAFDQNILYNYSSLDCFIVHPELIHPQIHDPILHHHTSSTSVSYSLLDSFDVSTNDVERIMDSVVVGDSDTINEMGDIVRKENHIERYF